MFCGIRSKNSSSLVRAETESMLGKQYSEQTRFPLHCPHIERNEPGD